MVGPELNSTNVGGILYRQATEDGICHSRAQFSKLCGKAPNYLTDSGGNLSADALANLVRTIRGAGADEARNRLAEKALSFLVGA